VATEAKVEEKRKKSTLAFWPTKGMKIWGKIYLLLVYFSFFVLSLFMQVVLKTKSCV
jgi:hypothetical protein